MPKKQLSTRPSWPIPLDEDLAQSVPGKAVAHIENHHEGLTKIEIEAIYMNDAGAKVPQGTVQTFELPDSGRGRVPALNALSLAQIVMCRCEEYAEKKRRKVVFIVHLFGSNAKSQSFKHRFQFTVDGTPDDMSDDESDDADEEEDDDDEDDENDDEQGFEEMRTGFVAARPLQLGPSSAVSPSEVEMMPAGSTAMEVARSPAGQESVMLASVQRAFSGAMAEHRALSQQVRMENSTTIRDMRSMFNDALAHTHRSHQQILDFMLERLKAAEDRAASSENRLIEMSRLEGTQRESLMEVTQQGWIAFIEGMRMKAEVTSTQQEYDRAFLGLQLQNLQSGQRKSAAGGALKSLLPFAASGLAAVLRARGDEQSAATIDALSKTVMKATLANAQGEEGEQEYEDEEDGPLPPIVVAVRQLRTSLTDEQQQVLKREMPKAAWRLFEGAAKSDMEESCLACLVSMHQFLQSDASLQIRVFGALEPEQQQQLMAIVAHLQGPGAAAPAPVKPPATNGAPKGTPFGAQGQPAPSSAPRRMPPRPGGPPPTPA